MTDYLFNEEVIDAAYKKSVRDEVTEEITKEASLSMLASLASQGLLSPEQAEEEARRFQTAWQ